jgi:hypothetical protein
MGLGNRGIADDNRSGERPGARDRLIALIATHQHTRRRDAGLAAVDEAAPDAIDDS